MYVPATCVSLAAGVPDNVWLRSSDPAVESHRLRDFNLPCSNGGTQPDVVYAGRRWAFSRTYFERETDALRPGGSCSGTAALGAMEEGEDERRSSHGCTVGAVTATERRPVDRLSA